MNIIELTNKTFVVTGSGSGIGRETAKVLSEQGARVILLDLNQEGLDETLASMAGIGHVVKACDLTAFEALPDLVKDIVAETGPIDGLVHCAGISSRKPLNVLRPAGFSKVMDVNFYSFEELTRLFTKKGNMKDGGSIVVMSSVSSIKGYKAKTEYCVSKAAVDAFVRCMAQELASRNIRINSIMPGAVNTPLAQKAKEMALAAGTEIEKQLLGDTEPYEVANTIAFLLSDATRTITGTSIQMGGGKSLEFENKTIVVVGAGGIGAAVAQTLNRQGARIALVDLNKDVTDAVVESLTGNCKGYQCNFTELSTIATIVKEIVTDMGAVDGLVFCAGLSDARSLKQTTPDFMLRMMNVNFFSYIELIRNITRKGYYREGLNIVGISSVGAILGNPAQTAYAASKAAMNGAVRCLAKELATRGIRINNIAPGTTDTPMYRKAQAAFAGEQGFESRLERQYLGLCQPEDIADAVAFLMSERSRMITGSCLGVDGGKLTS